MRTSSLRASHLHGREAEPRGLAESADREGHAEPENSFELFVEKFKKRELMEKKHFIGEGFRGKPDASPRGFTHTEVRA